MARSLQVKRCSVSRVRVGPSFHARLKKWIQEIEEQASEPSPKHKDKSNKSKSPKPNKSPKGEKGKPAGNGFAPGSRGGAVEKQAPAKAPGVDQLSKNEAAIQAAQERRKNLLENSCLAGGEKASVSAADIKLEEVDVEESSGLVSKEDEKEKAEAPTVVPTAKAVAAPVVTAKAVAVVAPSGSAEATANSTAVPPVAVAAPSSTTAVPTAKAVATPAASSDPSTAAAVVPAAKAVAAKPGSSIVAGLSASKPTSIVAGLSASKPTSIVAGLSAPSRTSAPPSSGGIVAGLAASSTPAAFKANSRVSAPASGAAASVGGIAASSGPTAVASSSTPNPYGTAAAGGGANKNNLKDGVAAQGAAGPTSKSETEKNLEEDKMGNCAGSKEAKKEPIIKPTKGPEKKEEKPAEKKQFSWEKKQSINKKDYMLMDRKNEVIVKEGLQLQQFVVDGCENCDIFVLDPMATVSIDYSKNCRIFMGPIESSIFVRNCENCSFVMCVQQFRSRECKDCKMALFSQTDPIIEYSNNMEFSCFPLCYFALKQQLDICKINAYANKWYKIFDFNKREDGVLNYSLAKAYNTKETLKELIDFEKCTSTELRDEVFQHMESGGLFPVIPITVGPLRPSCDPAAENRVFVLFLEEEKLNLFLQKFHEANAGGYEVLQSRVLGLDKARAEQLQVFDIKKLDLSRGELPCIGLDLCGKGLNAKASDFAAELEGSYVIPTDKIIALSELFFVTLQDDEGMAHSLK